ncbi:exodeoxyribonuclease VII large subunit [Algoriphagus hitonicola]|uniref:Exodeoxyribonuclease 7 large subunit n=1 Tax=Algoriphagus hitonicola TaxID=435880 RepID=A0A1I2T5W2_9BACT|nr:exodeoxyribonuclease VII large subunit [Algoriphagus hitonicola]SFG60292.1 Exodeoxyribonuclease VII large subunit [Algoriphagus hitonicola]
MQNAYSISQLGELIKLTLENELEPTYWVIGEVADFRQAPQGHAYFELVEKQGNQVLAKMRSNCWQFTFRGIASRFESITGSGLKNGMKVLAQVQATFHPVYGFSLNIKDIDASFSLGERARIRQETLDRLTREGLLRINASRPFPQVIQKIAIISSATAAGYGDFINQLEQNSAGYKIYHRLYPAPMQGNEAVNGLINALDAIERDQDQLRFEAIVLIRGGGAQLDLDCFDDYRLAAKIAQTSLPVLTGIGHERDETVADLVAHTRLKTPTAVAEFLLSAFRIFEENVNLMINRIDRLSRQQLKTTAEELSHAHHRLKSAVQSRLNVESEKLKSKHHRVILSSKNILQNQGVKLDLVNQQVHRSSLLFLKNANAQLDFIEKQLEQLNPSSILSRGYTRSEIGGKPVQLANPKLHDELITYSQNQKIKSKITDIDTL